MYIKLLYDNGDDGGCGRSSGRETLAIQPRENLIKEVQFISLQ